MQLLLFKLTGKKLYKDGFMAFMDSFMATKKTPKGLIYFDQVPRMHFGGQSNTTTIP